MPIAVIAQPDNNPPRVLLEVSGLSGSTATIVRTDPDGRTRNVRTAEPASLTSGAWTGFDYEAPFGQPFAYHVIRDDGTKDTTTNVARGKPVTLPGGFNAHRITDGTVNTDQFAGVDGAGTATIDLGAAHTVSGVRVWHYYADGRTYHDTKLEVSDDATTWTVVFNSANHGPNLLTGSDYEAATLPAGVSGLNGVTPAIVTPGQDSTQAVGVTTDSAVNAQGIIHMTPTGTSVPAGTKVRCSAWVLAPSGQAMTLEGRAHNVDNDTVITAAAGAVTFTGTGAWQHVEGPEWADAASAWRPGVQVRVSTAVSGVAVHMDNAKVTRRTEYAETDAGRAYTFAPRSVRYVRQTANGSSANAGTHFVETQVLAPAAVSQTLPVPDVWLIHPGIPDLSVRVPAERVDRLEERSRGARSAVHQPLGRSTPIVVSDIRPSTSAGISVFTDTLDERDDLWGLLARGVAVLVNIPAALGWGVTYEWAAVGEVTEAYFARGLSTARIFSLPYQVVDRPAGGLAAQFTYSDVTTERATYNDVVAAYATYSDLLSNTPT